MHTIDTDSQGGVCRVRLGGEVTIYQAAEVRQAISALLPAHDELEIDLSGVTELDSAGVQVLLVAKRDAAANGGACRLVQHSPAVIEVFDAMNIGGLFGDPMLLSGSHTQQQRNEG